MTYQDPREAQAARDAIKNGLELVTMRGAAGLFHKTPDAIRMAKSRGQIHAAFQVRFSDKDVPLFSLQNLSEAWGEPASEALQRMRDQAHPFFISGAGLWAVLHDGPIVAVDAAAVEGAAD